jgi:KaiC/GvpD/RAD55 family RecA-like ATPase
METLKEPLQVLLDSRKYNADYIPNKDQLLWTIGKSTIATNSNFVILTGLPKTGKSTFLSALISTVFTAADLWGMKLHLPAERRKIAYFDTESSDYDFYRQVERIKKFAGINGIPEWCSLYTFREDEPKDILAMVEFYLASSNAPIVIIDGILDTILDFNDPIESKKLINWFKRVTKVYDCCIIGVLHQGKGQAGSTLGHLGSNTDRYAQSTIEIVKDKEKQTFTMSPRFLRSSEDFEPITLINNAGEWQQVSIYGSETNETKEPVKKKTELSDRDTLHRSLYAPKTYKQLVSDLQEITGKGVSASKGIVKDWIEKNWIYKENELYKIKN